MSLYAEMRDYLENAPVTGVARRWTVEDAIPTDYQGITFRSKLESAWARTLDHYAITWDYEPQAFRLRSGKLYLPDFWLPELETFIEVKGPHMLRTDKTCELAWQSGTRVITLLGFPALRRNLGPATRPDSMQWLDPLGYDTRFAQCLDCETWQWLRPQLSRICRCCGETCRSLLAKSGEMQFIPAQDEPFAAPSWLESALNAMVPRR